MMKYRNLLVTISRVILGIVFMFSGFVKCVDPLGSTYKFVDYFNAFGADWATGLAFGLSLVMAVAEFLIGFTLFANVKMKLSIIGLSIFMAIFTPLTLYLAIANPVHDCGCFGDALILTNWQTFWKNVIFLIPTLVLIKYRKDIPTPFKGWEQWGIAAVATIFAFGIGIYGLKHLPMFDYRPYKVGTYIPDGMIIPEGAPVDKYDYKFVYEKDGEKQTFGMNNLPDSTWTYVDREVTLIEKGYEPPIHDFAIMSLEGDNITDNVLYNEGYSFLLVAYDLSKSDVAHQQKINDLALYAQSRNIPFYALTASTDADMEDFIAENNPTYSFYNTDEITLKTIVRANPGLVLIKEGTIINKWHANDIPEANYWHEILFHQSVKEYKNLSDNYLLWILLLAGVNIILLYRYLRFRFGAN